VAEHSIGTERFNAFVEGLDYPLFVVTTEEAGQRSGCLVGFASQVSIHPPRMLVCISENNHTYRLLQRAGHAAVHLLSPDQDDLARLFGEETGDDTDKFRHCAWHTGPGGVPLLDDAARHLVGRVLHRTPFGDHLGLLLEPVAVDVSDRAVAYTLSDASELEAGHRP
jgi:flavin reductase (DIM6/NTAB) family NADH-FMN oxidoreductase RutF